MERVLVLCDDLWHPAEVIEKGFARMEGEAYHFDFIMAVKDILTPELLDQYPVVINCKSNNVIAANTEPWFEEGVTEVCPQQFRDYVEQGGGFISIHSGNAFSEQFCRTEEKFQRPCREYIDFIGNRFTGHPPRCPVSVHVTNPKHPVMKGVNDFTERDEHYQVEVFAEGAETLFETTSETGGVQTGGYVKEAGRGRLCVLMPGHTMAVWENDNFRQMVLNAIAWCKKDR